MDIKLSQNEYDEIMSIVKSDKKIKKFGILKKIMCIINIIFLLILVLDVLFGFYLLFSEKINITYMSYIPIIPLISLVISFVNNLVRTKYKNLIEEKYHQVKQEKLSNKEKLGESNQDIIILKETIDIKEETNNLVSSINKYFTFNFILLVLMILVFVTYLIPFMTILGEKINFLSFIKSIVENISHKENINIDNNFYLSTINDSLSIIFKKDNFVVSMFNNDAYMFNIAILFVLILFVGTNILYIFCGLIMLLIGINTSKKKIENREFVFKKNPIFNSYLITIFLFIDSLFMLICYLPYKNIDLEELMSVNVFVVYLPLILSVIYLIIVIYLRTNKNKYFKHAKDYCGYK